MIDVSVWKEVCRLSRWEIERTPRGLACGEATKPGYINSAQTGEAGAPTTGPTISRPIQNDPDWKSHPCETPKKPYKAASPRIPQTIHQSDLPVCTHPVHGRPIQMGWKRARATGRESKEVICTYIREVCTCLPSYGMAIGIRTRALVVTRLQWMVAQLVFVLAGPPRWLFSRGTRDPMLVRLITEGISALVWAPTL